MAHFEKAIVTVIGKLIQAIKNVSLCLFMNPL